MSLFRCNPKAEVHRTLNRLLNSTTSISAHVPLNEVSEQRGDARITRIVPVVILPLLDNSDNNLNVGLTRDLSAEGMAVSTLGKLPVGVQLAVGIGNEDQFTVLLCKCIRCDPIGYGFFQSGIQVEEVLPSKDFIPLKNFAHYLQSDPPDSLLALMEEKLG